MEGYDIEPFWIDYVDEEAVSTVLWFYYEVAMGEHLEDTVTPEEALFILKVDLDMRTPPELGLLFLDITIFAGGPLDAKQATP